MKFEQSLHDPGSEGAQTGTSHAQVAKPPAYAIFEGGGAKGITHVGALRAFRENYWLVGAAGASAGAIIASLAAVGYQADDLFDELGGTDILTRNGTSPLGLLGRRRWLLAGWAVSQIPAALVQSILALTILALTIWTGQTNAWPILAVPPCLLLIIVLFLLLPVLSRGGFLTTDTMRDQLDRLLRARLEVLYHARGVTRRIGDYVTFADMDPAVIQDACSLKIVVTDIRRRRLMQFDQSCPNVSVADAVAASAALPLIFSPPRIRGLSDADQSVFVDGGLVSNLPVWAFVTEKKMFERSSTGGSVPIFAFTLNSTGEATQASHHPGPLPREANMQVPRERCAALLRPLSMLVSVVEWSTSAPFRLLTSLVRSLRQHPFRIIEHVRDVLNTGIFGSQTVVQDFVTDLRIVEMTSPLTTVSFGCTRERAASAHRAGYEQASACLADWRHEFSATKEILEDILPDIRAELNSRRRSRGIETEPHLRLSIVDPTKSGSFQVKISVEMDEDADDRMEFDPRNSAAPAVFKTKLATLAPYDRSPGSIAHVMTKYERALLERSRQWVISVPIYRLSEGRVPHDLKDRIVERVLCLDSDDDLQIEFADSTFVEALSNLAVVLAE